MSEPRIGSDAEKLARAVLLFFAGGSWTENEQWLWRELTGTDNATSRTLCDLARKVRNREAALDGTIGQGSDKPGTTARDTICDEVLRIMQIYHQQEASSYGVDTPGGLEHMGDVWSLFLRWEQMLKNEP